MRRLLIIPVLVLLLAGSAYAATGSAPVTWATGDSVTASKLNQNQSAVWTVLNGGLDNDNADTGDGFRFFEVKAALPSAGTQGRVIFDTSDNSLNFDNGSSWQPVMAPTGTASTGKIAYYSSGWKLLSPGTQYYALVSNGTSSNPSYQQINLANGVTSTLPIANGGTGQTTAQAAIDALLPEQTGNSGKFLTTDGSNSSWATATVEADAGVYAVNATWSGATPTFTCDAVRGNGTDPTTPDKIKEVIISRTGTYTVKFTLGNSGSGGTNYGRIYKDGVAFGTTQSGATEHSEDLAFSRGDKCQLYVWSTGGGSVTSGSNFRLYEAIPNNFPVTYDQSN